MKTKIDLNKALKMVLGSSIYSTGGGIELSVQKKLFQKLFKKYPDIDLTSLDELDPNDFICCSYSVGSGGKTNVDLTSSLKKGFENLEKVTNKKFKGIFSGETNIDILPFQAAASLDLPVIDADGTGGRAVPEIQFDNFFIKNKSITPLVAITPDGKTHILMKEKDPLKIEEFVRKLAIDFNGQLVSVLDHPIKVKDAKDVLTLGIFSRSIKLGELIKKNHNNSDILNKIISQTDGKLLIQGRIVKIKTGERQGFLTGEYFVEDSEGNMAKIYLKNENLLCWYNNKLVFAPPDSILNFNIDKLTGSHNSKLSIGDSVMVILKKATKLWDSKKGRALFSAKYFGFSDIVEL